MILLGTMIGFREPATLETLLLLADIETARVFALVIGAAAFVGGILLLFNHKRDLERSLDAGSTERQARFERRKFRRRAISSSLMASVGFLVGGFYWVTEQQVFAIFVTLILGLLGAISILAMIDFFSVGLKQLATPDENSERAMLEEIVRKHREAKEQNEQQD